MKRYEQYFRPNKKTELFIECWYPDTTPPKGHLFITHGLGEHSGAYNELATELCQRLNWSIFAWSLPGHGRSTGLRGWVVDFEEYIHALEHSLEFVRQTGWLKEDPVLFGHSMGGLITTSYCLATKPKTKGVILSAPAFGIHPNSMPSALKETLGKWVYRLYPSFTTHSGIHFEQLTQIPEKQKEYQKDTLRHQQISYQTYRGLLEYGDAALGRAHEFTAPLLIQIGDKDTEIDNNAIQDFFNHVSSKEKKLHNYNDSLHEVFNDIERKVAVNDLANFLTSLE